MELILCITLVRVIQCTLTAFYWLLLWLYCVLCPNQMSLFVTDLQGAWFPMFWWFEIWGMVDLLYSCCPGNPPKVGSEVIILCSIRTLPGSGKWSSFCFWSSYKGKKQLLSIYCLPWFYMCVFSFLSPYASCCSSATCPFPLHGRVRQASPSTLYVRRIDWWNRTPSRPGAGNG